jgi:hypothetical protein
MCPPASEAIVAQLRACLSDARTLLAGIRVLSAMYGELRDPVRCVDVTRAMAALLERYGGTYL